MERPIRITCTVTSDLTYDQRMIRICNCLSDAGYEVVLVGRQLPDSIPLPERFYRQYRLRCFFHHGKLFYIEYQIRLFFYLLFKKTDIINSVDLDTLIPGYLISLLRRKVCVFDAHEYFSEVPEVVHRPLTKKIWETIAHAIIPRLKYCYTVGDGLADIFMKLYGTPFSVVRNMPLRANEIPVKTAPAGQKILFYQGAINAGRGIEELTSAMAMLGDFQLWIAGDGDLKASIEESCRQKPYAARIKFLGKITPDELKKITPQVWLGMNLLRNDGLSYYYSLANKYFDYVQAGVPVLQMAFPEYIRLNREFETAVLLSELDAASIVRAVRELEQDTEKYKGLQQNCKRAAEVWNWEQEALRLKEVYKGIAVAFYRKRKQ